MRTEAVSDGERFCLEEALQNEFFVDVKLIFVALLTFDKLSPQAECTVDDDSVFPLESILCTLFESKMEDQSNVEGASCSSGPPWWLRSRAFAVNSSFETIECSTGYVANAAIAS